MCNNKKIAGKMLTFMMSIVLLVRASYADTEMENSTLARINQILTSLKPLINEAEKSASPNARLHFHYPWLRQDIAKIQSGINQKIKETGIESNPISPLAGDYVRLNAVLARRPESNFKKATS